MVSGVLLFVNAGTMFGFLSKISKQRLALALQALRSIASTMTETMNQGTFAGPHGQSRYTTRENAYRGQRTKAQSNRVLVRLKWYPPHWTEKGPAGVRAYAKGCRCAACTEANRIKQADYRKRAGRKKYGGNW